MKQKKKKDSKDLKTPGEIIFTNIPKSKGQIQKVTVKQNDEIKSKKAEEISKEINSPKPDKLIIEKKQDNKEQRKDSKKEQISEDIIESPLTPNIKQVEKDIESFSSPKTIQKIGKIKIPNREDINKEIFDSNYSSPIINTNQSDLIKFISIFSGKKSNPASPAHSPYQSPFHSPRNKETVINEKDAAKEKELAKEKQLTKEKEEFNRKVLEGYYLAKPEKVESGEANSNLEYHHTNHSRNKSGSGSGLKNKLKNVEGENKYLKSPSIINNQSDEEISQLKINQKKDHSEIKELKLTFAVKDDEFVELREKAEINNIKLAKLNKEKQDIEEKLINHELDKIKMQKELNDLKDKTEHETIRLKNEFNDFARLFYEETKNLNEKLTAKSIEPSFNPNESIEHIHSPLIRLPQEKISVPLTGLLPMINESSDD